jgi:hypothetical protein
VGFDTDTEHTVRSIFDFIIRQRLVAQVLPVGIMNRNDDGSPTRDATRVLSDTNYGATVFVSHLPTRIRAHHLQMLINQGHDRMTSWRRLPQLSTPYERTLLFGQNRCFQVWRPAMAAHVERLTALERHFRGS